MRLLSWNPYSLWAQNSNSMGIPKIDGLLGKVYYYNILFYTALGNPRNWSYEGHGIHFDFRIIFER